MNKRLKFGFNYNYLVMALLLCYTIYVSNIYISTLIDIQGYYSRDFAFGSTAWFVMYIRYIFLSISLECLIRSVIRNRAKWLPLFVFSVWFLHEMGQHFDITPGTFNPPWDLIMYAIGSATMFLHSAIVYRKVNSTK